MGKRRGYNSFVGTPLQEQISAILSSYSFSFIPYSDAVTDLGSSSKRVRTVYATSISDGVGAITIPDQTVSGDTLVTTKGVQTLDTKDFNSPTSKFITVYGDGLLNPYVRLKATLASTDGVNLVLTPPSGGSGFLNIALPNIATTLVGRDTVDTLTNKTYSGGTYSPTETSQATTFSWVGSGSSGSTGSGSVTLVYTKFGNFVFVSMPAITGTNGAGGSSAFQSGATDVPAAFRPSATTKNNCAVPLSLNGAWQSNAAIRVTSGGQLTFASDPAFNNIPASNSISVLPFSFMYYIGT